MKRLTSALLTVLLLCAATSFAVLADETLAPISDEVTGGVPVETEPVVVPPVTEESKITTPEPTETTTPEPTESTTPEPTESTTPEPTESTTKKPKPTETTTKKPKPTEATTPEPTSEPVTAEPPATKEPATEEPEITAAGPDTEKPDGSTTTSKRPVRTEMTDETEITTDVTAEVTTDAEDDVFTDKKMFATPLEAVSFVLGILVIIFVFITLFTIVRRIVKKYTSGR